jgi:hypothetical protein
MVGVLKDTEEGVEMKTETKMRQRQAKNAVKPPEIGTGQGVFLPQ